jgi:predicted XRE-type DNA-binding protein
MAVASLEVPPNSAMISEVVMSENSVTEFRNSPQVPFPNRDIYRSLVAAQITGMISTGEILAELQKKLDAKDITKTRIAEVAGIGKNRVSELFGSGTGRRLLHDEAVKLVEGFGLERPQAPQVAPVSPQILRLVVQYIAGELGVPLTERQAEVAELAEDVRAFAELLRDPKYRDAPEVAETFFQAMRLRRPAPEKADPPRNGQHH